MNTKSILRCAIYTRKSSEDGLDQDFNSLHAQREACAAYIASQKHENWQAGAGPARADQTLLKTIVRAHKWFNDLVFGRVHNMAEIATLEGIDKSYVSRVMAPAFPAPVIIESIIAGRQPADLSAEKLTKRIDLPPDWAQQHQLLGFV